RVLSMVCVLICFEALVGGASRSEEPPDAIGGVEGPHVSLAPLARDDVRDAAAPARAPVARGRYAAAIVLRPPGDRAVHHLRGTDRAPAAGHEQDRHGPASAAATQAKRPCHRRHGSEPVGELAAEQTREEAAVRHAGGEDPGSVDAALALQPIEQGADEITIPRLLGAQIPPASGGAEERDAVVALGIDGYEALPAGQLRQARSSPQIGGRAPS